VYRYSLQPLHLKNSKLKKNYESNQVALNLGRGIYINDFVFCSELKYRIGDVKVSVFECGKIGGSSPGQVQPSTIQLVFAVFQLST
jgi:hypothetical protein